MANLILFGAGASFGSDVTGTPPLGAGLFRELTRFNPDGWGALPPQTAQDFNRDFELAMSRVNPHAIPPLQRAMAAYFFEFLPRTTSLYIEFARRIRARNWPGAICSLNYERLLELSLAHIGVQPFIGDRPPGGNVVELCLPHGCSHIFCDAARGSANGVSFAAFGVQTDGPVSIIADPAAHRQRVLNDAFPPVMSYFEPAKRTTAGASFIRDQRARWVALAAEAAKVAVVGVRVRAHDDHIWGPLAASPAQIVYCGGPGDVPEYNAWMVAARCRKDDIIIDNYFRGGFDRICAELSI